ncbi:hypothetical protein U1Q18_028485 [Sarracenia purpurea var. burkii]
MPKERRDRSLSSDRSRTSPFPCSSSRRPRQSLPKNPSNREENVKEWEAARCPICMEHPHNAVLLVCSSHKKGCRPFVCDTSHRHSNCFDQLHKSFSETSSSTVPHRESIQYSSDHSTHDVVISEAAVSNLPVERSEKVSKLVCPLCRGQVTSWIVIDSARRFMNAKSRCCASETCDFSGTYKDLRRHARLVHPSVRPSEVDLERQQNWRRLERQRDLGDLISTLSSSIGEERGEDDILSFDEGGWLTVFFLVRVFQPESSLRSNSWSSTSRSRTHVTVRRRSTRLWGETHDGETGSISRGGNNDSSDGGGSGPRELTRRQPTPGDEV